MIERATKKISVSPYLLRLHEDVSTVQIVDKQLTADQLIEQLKELTLSLTPSVFNNTDEAEERLIETNKRFSFLWCVAELLNIGTQPERGQWQTQFAEASIQYALSLAWQRIAKKQKSLLKHVQESPHIAPGLFIIGMGKLGGNDLNFSSDVDLIAYFDPDILPVPDAIGKSYVCHQVLQELTRILQQNGGSNFIWRVDWRLRPNASATSLAMSTVAAEDYYHYHASPWHRLALMKARVIAGDLKVGQAFLNSLGAFIWRQNLDFRALDELAEIKQRINLEHPGLRAQRKWVDPIGCNIDGFNVKLGSGGIREIEFIVNAKQLLWGGRNHQLRNPNTVAALHALTERERIEPSHAQRLEQAYQFLRKLENAVQMHSNQQTHLLPSGEGMKHDVLVLLGYDSWPVLVDELNHHRRFVNQLFLELFSEQEQNQLAAPVWPENVNSVTDDVLEAWENGFHIYGVSSSIRHKLKPLSHALADFLNDSAHENGTDVNDVVMRLHHFFKSLPQGEQYFRLLAESPSLLSRIIPPLLYSPAMTVLLSQSPHIVDCYVHGEWRYPQDFESQHIMQSDDYGERLERLRRFVNEHLYQLYQQFLRGELAPEILQEALTHLAEHTLEVALTLVAQDMQLDEVPITVIGMGKVALRRMSPMSDLDLIFVYDSAAVSMELASRFVGRLQTAIATPLREGIVYELDTRLRPSGKSGAPTVSVESFAQHHQQRAHTWEHIALMSARVVAGRRQPEPILNEIKQQLITTARDPLQLKTDARKMWLRVTEHRVKDTPLRLMNSKLRVGGLMQAEYLAACLVLAYGERFNTSSADLDDLLLECLPHYGLEELPDIIQFWRIQQLWERLLGKTEQPLSSLRDEYFSLLLKHSQCNSMDELLEKKKRYSNYVSQAMESFFDEANALTVKQIDDWLETSVQWRD